MRLTQNKVRLLMNRIYGISHVTCAMMHLIMIAVVSSVHSCHTRRCKKLKNHRKCDILICLLRQPTKMQNPDLCFLVRYLQAKWNSQAAVDQDSLQFPAKCSSRIKQTFIFLIHKNAETQEKFAIAYLNFNKIIIKATPRNSHWKVIRLRRSGGWARKDGQSKNVWPTSKNPFKMHYFESLKWAFVSFPPFRLFRTQVVKSRTFPDLK